jgi:hypothetical protein
VSVSRRILNWTQSKKSGFALVIVLGFAAVLTVFTAAVGAQASFSLHAVDRKGQADQAYYGAYTGIQMSLALLKEPPEGIDFDGDNIPGDSWLEMDRSVLLPLPNGGQAAARLYHNLDYFTGSIRDTGPLDENGDPANVPPDGTEIPPDHFYIMAVGESASGIQTEAVTMGAAVAPDFPILNHAAYGLSRLNIEGTVDHFNSRDIPASPPSGFVPVLDPERSVPTDPNSAPPHDASVNVPLAHVGSSQDTPTDVIIGSAAKINGYLFVDSNGTGSPGAAFPTLPSGGPAVDAILMSSAAISDPYVMGGGGGGGATALDASGNPVLNGYVDRQTNNKRVPEITPPDDSLTLGGGGTYTVPAGGLALDEGNVYQCAGDFRCFGTSSVTVTDTDADGRIEPVTIIVAGNILFDGAIDVNQNRPPENLKFFAPNSTSFTLTNSSQIFSLIAGTDLNVSIEDNSELWGAVLGTDVTLDATSAIHFDRNLLDANTVAASFGFTTSGTASSAGAATSTKVLTTPTVGVGGGTTTTTTTGGTTTAPPPTTTTTGGTTTGGGGGGCGCGCGGGSMMLKMK